MAKELLPIDIAIADLLSEGVRESKLTYRQLAEKTGMSINRIGIILRKEPPPATVGEVGLLARAFGASGAALIQTAEDRVLGRESEVEQVSQTISKKVRQANGAD